MRHVIFNNKFLPYLLVAPQLAVTTVFFFWPAIQAIWQSAFLPDPFGLSSQFVGFDNFVFLFTDPYYLASFQTTIVFSASVTSLSLVLALLLAVSVDKIIRGVNFYRTLIIMPYAIAPAIAGVLWLFMFNPTVGIVSFYLNTLGYKWNHVLNGYEAMSLVVIASAWKLVSYNFLFFLAALQAIPKSIVEASTIDCPKFSRRFRTVSFPLITPTMFFLLVVNIIYAFFETFGVIHTITAGGPQQSTTIMVYKVYADGFVGQDLGSSAAQSVILLTIVGFFTVIQFRYVEKKVHYK